MFRGESHAVHGKELLEEVCGAEGGEVEAPGGRDEDDEPGEGDGEWGAGLAGGGCHG